MSEPKLVPSGFFVVRTPLLPVDEFLSWGSELSGQSTDADRAVLRQRLRTAFERPELREALFLASPSLDRDLDAWLAKPDSEHGLKIEQALVRYFSRMCTRCTPFGLFAGVSIGQIVQSGFHLELEPRERYRRHVRLDMYYLSALAHDLEARPSLRGSLTYTPNTSLYLAGGMVRYVETHHTSTGRSFRLVGVEPSEALEQVLHRAAAGARFEELVEALAVGSGISSEDAALFVTEVVSSQLLVSNLEPAMTGPEPLGELLTLIGGQGELNQMATVLTGLAEELKSLDADPPGVSPSRYRGLARQLEVLPARVDESKLFQVDLIKAGQLEVSSSLSREIVRGARLLSRLSVPRPDPLAAFKEDFIRRFGEREVALAEVLDAETGIGFTGDSTEDSRLLAGRISQPPREDLAAWSPRDRYLAERLAEMRESGDREWALEEEDVRALGTGDGLEVPFGLSFAVCVDARSQRALAQGEYLYSLECSGPSGVEFLTRFCHADVGLAQKVATHLSSEREAAAPAALVEIVHLPDDRSGNVMLRPVARELELPFLGRSGAPLERQLRFADLTVSVRSGRVVLFSHALQRAILPRLTSAHDFVDRGVGVYRFFGAVQLQDARSLRFRWGALQDWSFLPRVVKGKQVLSLARWSVEGSRLKAITGRSARESLAALHALRKELGLPRYFQVGEQDTLLVVDSENILSVESFTALVASRPRVTLSEVFPPLDSDVVRGPEGRFVSEFVFPFAREGLPAEEPHTRARPPLRSMVSFPPGGEWLSAKLYSGTTTADQVLREVVGGVARAALASGAADRWFFARERDPDPSLRLVLHGLPGRLWGEVAPRLFAHAAPLNADGRVWRLQVDTFERDVDGMGGAAAIELAERAAWADSEAVLAIIEAYPHDEGYEARWRLVLKGFDVLLASFGFDLAERVALLEEVQVGAEANHQAGEVFRAERESIETLLHASLPTGSSLAEGMAALEAAAGRWKPLLREIRQAGAEGRLTQHVPVLARRLFRAHANRMFPSSAALLHEIVSSVLMRSYRSELARAGRNA